MTSQEEDYMVYKNLYEEKKRLEEQLAEISLRLKEKREELEKSIEEARKKVDYKLILQASKEYETYMLKKIKEAMERDDVSIAMRLVAKLESHLDIRRPEKLKEVSEILVLSKGRTEEIRRYEKERGKILKEIYLSPKRDLLHYYRFEYDGEGRVIKRLRFTKGDRLDGIELVKYGSAKEIIEEEYQDPQGDLQWRCLYEYHKKTNRLEKKIWVDNRGRRIKSWIYKYNSHKKPIRIIWQDDKGKTFGYTECHYDSEGRLLKEIRRDKRGEVLKEIEYKYQ